MLKAIAGSISRGEGDRMSSVASASVTAVTECEGRDDRQKARDRAAEKEQSNDEQDVIRANRDVMNA